MQLKREGYKKVARRVLREVCKLWHGCDVDHWPQKAAEQSLRVETGVPLPPPSTFHPPPSTSRPKHYALHPASYTLRSVPQQHHLAPTHHRIMESFHITEHVLLLLHFIEDLLLIS